MSAATDIREPEAHPAATLFPLLDDEQLSDLIESMRSVGFDSGKPILRYRGQVLDGRNRLRAAAFAGVEPVFHDLPDDCDPYQESWRHNGIRRDLTKLQKAAIFAKIKTASEEWQREQEERREAANRARAEKAKGNTNAEKKSNGAENSRSSNEDPPFSRPAESKPDNRSVTALAQEAGVGRSTMERALKLQKEEPEKLEAVIRGEKKPRKNPRDNVNRTWGDIEHVAATLEGATIKVESLAETIEQHGVAADDKERKACIKSLSESSSRIRRLRKALEQK